MVLDAAKNDRRGMVLTKKTRDHLGLNEDVCRIEYEGSVVHLVHLADIDCPSCSQQKQF